MRRSPAPPSPLEVSHVPPPQHRHRLARPRPAGCAVPARRRHPAGPETAAQPAVPLADATAGAGTVTPAMRREIDAVLAAGRTPARRTSGARLRPAALVRDQVRCADFEGQRYCLHAGWTDSSPAEVVSDLAGTAAAQSARSAYREETGDLTLVDQLRQRARLSPAARERADRAELTAAARSVAKVWLLRHQVQGVALPDGFLARHPEVRTRTASGTTAAADRKTFRGLPGDGPGAAQDRGLRAEPQLLVRADVHADDRAGAGATRGGASATGPTSSAPPPRAARSPTGPGDQRADRAGTVPTTPASTSSSTSRAGRYRQWYTLQMRHTVDYRAPIDPAPGAAGEVATPTSTTTPAGTSRSAAATTRTATDPNLMQLLRAVEPAAVRSVGALHRPACSGGRRYRQLPGQQGALPAQHRRLMRAHRGTPRPRRSRSSCSPAAGPTTSRTADPPRRRPRRPRDLQRERRHDRARARR